MCIVGGGIAGLTCAYLLLSEGRHVTLLDDGPIGGGETARTTAHLASMQDDRFSVLERHHGKRAIELIAESHAAAIDKIESICANENIQCSFRRLDGYLFNPPNGSPTFLERELAAARRAGLRSAEMVVRVPLPGFDTGPAIRIPRQAQLHPLAYLRGLARAVERLGGAIHTGVHVEHVDSGTPATLRLRGGRRLRADSVIVATNAPIVSRVGLPIRQAAFRSYVIAMAIPKGMVPLGLYWDTDEPYHYARLVGEDGEAAGDTLVVGGEDHRTGQATDAAQRYDRLEEWARTRFPAAGAVVARWSGQVMEPADGIAFIGRAPGTSKNVYVVTGDSGQGMTHGTLGAMLIADLVAGRDNPWAPVYDPRRSVMRSAGSVLKENANTTMQYFDWLRGGDVGSVEEVPRGQGAIVRRGARLLAVYRDESGRCLTRSAVCPHLGGIVAFNAAEKTWDCPCHGSRFDVEGHVINGPAASDLAPVEVDHPEPVSEGAPAHGGRPSRL
ncbi:MAG: FAD-dependent oxidoreductase [Polyangiaceae bacterium]|nr:FAD-dependent oxidoreductase [Polyangiaceae bacterium]